MIMKVAVRFFQHSPIFGQRASSQTVEIPYFFTMDKVSANPTEAPDRTFIHSGLTNDPIGSNANNKLTKKILSHRSQFCKSFVIAYEFNYSLIKDDKTLETVLISFPSV